MSGRATARVEIDSGNSATCFFVIALGDREKFRPSALAPRLPLVLLRPVRHGIRSPFTNRCVAMRVADRHPQISISPDAPLPCSAPLLPPLQFKLKSMDR